VWKRSLPLLAAFAVLLPLGSTDAQSRPTGPTVRTPAEVEALIETIGRKPPAWFKKTKLRYPKTLDLAWPPDPPPPWNTSKNVGQFLWSVINENPSRWKEGVRFLHHLLVVNQDDPEVVERTMKALGRAYYNLHEDWARAAFWWRKAGNGDTVGLADCCWKLGSKEMALDILERIGADRTRNGAVIKLWSDIGELDEALQLAEARADDAGFRAAGDACRKAGDYEKAVAYYDQVLALKKGGRDLEGNQLRARASIEAVQLFDALDLKSIKSGKYQAESLSYAGPLEVEVVVRRGKIKSVTVTRMKDKQYYSALTDTPRQILDNQSVRGVDATTGATITSEAIINATAKALHQGLKKKKQRK